MNSKKHRLIAGNKPWTSSGNSLPPHVGGQTLEEMQDQWDELIQLKELIEEELEESE